MEVLVAARVGLVCCEATCFPQTGLPATHVDVFFAVRFWAANFGVEMSIWLRGHLNPRFGDFLKGSPRVRLHAQVYHTCVVTPTLECLLQEQLTAVGPLRLLSVLQQCRCFSLFQCSDGNLGTGFRTMAIALSAFALRSQKFIFVLLLLFHTAHERAHALRTLVF